MLKIVGLVVCLVVICVNLAIGQHSKANDVFHLMRMVLWMLFMFVGNVFLADLPVIQDDPKFQIAAMSAWLGASFLLSWLCVKAFRHGARV